jgi:hypothetical protein
MNQNVRRRPTPDEMDSGEYGNLIYLTYLMVCGGILGNGKIDFCTLKAEKYCHEIQMTYMCDNLQVHSGQ